MPRTIIHADPSPKGRVSDFGKPPNATAPSLKNVCRLFDCSHTVCFGPWMLPNQSSGVTPPPPPPEAYPNKPDIVFGGRTGSADKRPADCPAGQSAGSRCPPNPCPVYSVKPPPPPPPPEAGCPLQLVASGLFILYRV